MADKKMGIDFEVNLLKGSDFGNDILKPSSGKSAFDGLGEKNSESGAEDPNSTISLSERIIQVAKIATTQMLFITLVALPVVISQLVTLSGLLLWELAKKLKIDSILNWFGEKKDWVLNLFKKTEDDEKEMHMEESAFFGGSEFSFNVGEGFFGGEDEESGLTEPDASGGIDSRSLEEINKMQDTLNKLIELHESGNFIGVQDILNQMETDNLFSKSEIEQLRNSVNTPDFLRDVEQLQNELNAKELDLKLNTHIDDSVLGEQASSSFNSIYEKAEETENKLASLGEKSIGNEENYTNKLVNIYDVLQQKLGTVASFIEFIRNPTKLEAPDQAKARSEVDGMLGDITNLTPPNFSVPDYIMGNNSGSISQVPAGQQVPNNVNLNPRFNRDGGLMNNLIRSNGMVQDYNVSE
jgi:hypothetical protein